jgi:hypothetical protein
LQGTANDHLASQNDDQSELQRCQHLHRRG